MPFYKVWPDEARLTAAGFGRVADVPVIFNDKWVYQTEPSQFLRERSLRDWSPRNARKSITTLTERSRSGFADCLINFLDWCELRRHDWRLIEYEKHIIEGYQKEMSAGSYSATHSGLEGTTVNLRVQEVCNFLEWAHFRCLRDEFVTPTKTVPRKSKNPYLSHGHKTSEVEVRVGAAREKPKSLHMPSRAAVADWLESVRIEKGFTKHLMAELILKSAIRREEAVQWRIWTLPEERANWVVKGSEVAVEVEYGAKGAKRLNKRGDVVGPLRVVMIPLETAEKLHAFRETKRLKFFANYVKAGKTADERAQRKKNSFVQLFLSDFTGQPVSRQSFYTGWKEPRRQPLKGWSPHLGRHYWACNEILIELEKNLAVLKHVDKSQIPIDWIRGNVQDVLLLRIQPQLGHIDERTTELYIGWAIQHYRGSSVGDEFELALEE